MTNEFSKKFRVASVTEITKTLCPYCGVGCGLEVVGSEEKVNNKQEDHSNSTNLSQTLKVRGDRSHPSSQGMVCVKGATIAESIDKDRLLYPMFRKSLDDPFAIISWEEAFNLIVERIESVRENFGSQSLCMYGSGQMQSEDYYIAQKLLKGCLGTNNFDSNSRLCMSSAVKGYAKSLGSDGPPCCYEDLELTDCAFIVGSNAAECHPIVFNRFQKHHKKNPKVKLVVVDPRRTPTAEAADLHLAIRPGTDIDLLNGIAYLLILWGAIDREFIDQSTNNFTEFSHLVEHYTPEIVAERCQISVEDLEKAARYCANAQSLLTLWSMGINQSSEGTAKVCSIINLHLLTGQIGKPGAGPFSLTGQPNAMGGREVGGLSNLLPGYRFVDNPQHREELEEFWGLPPGQISPQRGRTASEIITGLESGDVKILWIVATNPAVSLPNLERSKAALKSSPFTIYQDAYYPTETASYAHLLLPAAQWGEKTGTMTNSERVVTLAQAFRLPLGEAKADWEIFAIIAKRLGFGDKFSFNNAAEVYGEFVQLTRNRLCDMTGITHTKLAQTPIQWPHPDLGLGTDENSKSQRLYTNHRFQTPNARANFIPYHSRGLAEPPDPNFPFILTTGRLYGHWHTQTRTGRIDKIRQMYPEPFLEIHPRDADNLGIVDKTTVEVRSRRGISKFTAKITRGIAPGTLFIPIHWGSLWADDAEANTLTHSESCPESLQPELKACAVQLVPIHLDIPIEKYQLQSSQW
jgi:ferredoxin-nitrate reductase